jgi:hypothetical protein
VIVIDASAMLEFLLQTPLGSRVEARLFRDRDEFPHRTCWTSGGQALRRLMHARGACPKAEEARRPFRLDIRRHSHPPSRPGLGAEQPHRVTRCMALAEALDAPLVTCDGARRPLRTRHGSR